MAEAGFTVDSDRDRSFREIHTRLISLGATSVRCGIEVAMGPKVDARLYATAQPPQVIIDVARGRGQAWPEIGLSRIASRHYSAWQNPGNEEPTYRPAGSDGTRTFDALLAVAQRTLESP
jgi:hypothetical protein